MADMTKRERVLRTMRFEETDRVPLYDIIQNDAIVEHYGGEPLTYENGDHLVGVAAGRTLDMTRMVGGPQRPREEVRSDGIRYRHERWTGWLLERPFFDLDTLVDWAGERIREANAQTFDSEYARCIHNHIEAKWTDFAEGDPTGRGDPTVFVIESGVGLEWIYWATGMELFTELLMLRPDVVEEWLEALSACEVRRARAMADPHYIPIALTFTDIAHKTGTMFDPNWLRQYWVPRLKRLNDVWHEAGCACLFHSDGNLWGVLDDLVEAGIDGLNPIEVLAGMTVKEVRAKYPKLFLAGGIDVSQLLTFGTPEEVRAACREAIEATGGRGYFMGSSTEIHWDVRLENAQAMFEATALPGGATG